MSRQVAETTVRASARPEIVWEVLADHTRYWEWGIWDESTIEREGNPPPNGLGTIRRLVTGKRVVREQITEFEKPAKVSYLVLSGIPLKDYRSTTTLRAIPEGTEIHWRSEFDVNIPFAGGMARKRMTGILEDVATKMAREAERRSPGPPA